MQFRHTHRNQGFTLVEMLIVIVVIAILALLVLPRVMGANRRSKEAALRANLWSVRQAVLRYHADTGAYPTTLPDLLIEPAKGDEAPDVGIDENGVEVTIPAGTYNGPYFATPQGGIDGSGLPINPFGPRGTGDLAADVDDHWRYENGLVFSAIDGVTIDGIEYADL